MHHPFPLLVVLVHFRVATRSIVSAASSVRRSQTLHQLVDSQFCCRVAGHMMAESTLGPVLLKSWIGSNAFVVEITQVKRVGVRFNWQRESKSSCSHDSEQALNFIVLLTA
jgi:hypothetical protein